MSAKPHGIHDRDARGLPLFCDGSPGCDHAVRHDHGLSLDHMRFARAWQRMIDVEINDEAYTSTLDKEIGSELYVMALLMQRHMGINPFQWPPVHIGALRDSVLRGRGR